MTRSGSGGDGTVTQVRDSAPRVTSMTEVRERNV